VKLDYNKANETFILKVPRGGEVKTLMREHGLDFSASGSTSCEAVLFTKDQYAAATFADYASDDALLQLGPILFEIGESWRATSSANIAVPADQELWPFQKANVEYALRRRNTLVGDQPGLGKTPTAIAFCNEVKAKKVLVICPANIRLQWHKRIQEWTTQPWPASRSIHTILKGTNGTNPGAAWTIVSYDLARTEAIGKHLAMEHYDVLILDEPHYLKEVDAQRTRAVFGGGRNPLFPPLAERAERILGLTGTPLPNRPREAYTLARGLCFDSIDWASEEKFKFRYNPSRRGETPSGKIFVDERTGRHAELQNRLRAWFMTRHVKHGPRGVMQQLHMPIYDLIQVEETRSVKQALAAESLLDIDPEKLEGADMTMLGHIAAVRRMMGIAMAPQIADYVEMLLDGGEEKLVLFAWHIEVMNILEKRLEKHGIVRMDGSTGAAKKDRLVKEFIANPRIKIALGNTLTMGTGTDGLQAVCNHALIAEPSWVPGDNQQCFDRLDRGGQTRQVQGDIFVAPGSVAEKVLSAALRKNKVTHKALDAQFGG
jgi:SWI/SNF-related matrix-associated actin-dependent regulator 1 of chromatin subfamily A